MAIKSNVKSFVPARQAFKQEITLLSHGFANPEAFPDGLITVYPWDSEIDEWIQQRVRKPQKNRLLWELCEKLCNLNGTKIEEFVMGDVHTVLLVARSIIHKNEVRYSPVCTHCNTVNPEDKVKIPDELEKIGEKTLDYEGWDSIVLPESKDHVKIRPLRVSDEIAIDGRTAEQKKVISDRLAHILSAVVTIGNGTEEGAPDNMQELFIWWQSLHPQDKNFIEQSQDRLFPHLGTAIRHRCETCGREFDHELQLDQDFFRRGGASVA